MAEESQHEELKPASTRIARPEITLEESCDPEILSELVHRLGHEVGNPLTAIISLAAILERFQDETDPSRLAAMSSKLAGYARSISDEAWKVSLLNERLVMFLSRREANQAKVDLVELVGRAERRIRARFGFSTIELMSNVAMSEPIYVMNDSEQLMILLSELLLNAFQATTIAVGDGVPAGPVSLFVRSSADRGIIVIRNEAKESYPGELNEVFRPLITTHDSHKHLGIGLPICVLILNRCGGEIRVVEERSERSVSFLVEITLPFAAIQK